MSAWIPAPDGRPAAGPARRALSWGILVWALYLVARTLVQRLVPAADWAAGVRQDEIITGFRLACGAAVCVLYARCWALSALLRWRRVGFWVWAGCGLLVAAHLSNALSLQIPAWFDWRVIAIDLAVGFNEEVSYRGLFQRALSELKGPAWGEWVGSLMFAAMHLGYQPLPELGWIFAWGLGAAKLRSRGAPMALLIAAHWLADCAYVVIWRRSALPLPWLAWVRVACLAGALGAAWLAGRARPGSGTAAA